MTIPTTQFDATQLKRINARLEKSHPSRILAWAVETFRDKMAQMSSFGLEDVALYDMFWRIDDSARLMTLDTLRLPNETYTVIDQTRIRYSVDIETFYPDLVSVKKMVESQGNNLFYRGLTNRKLCCGVRKVEPLERALSGVKAWVTGLRRDQGMERSEIGIVEFDESHANIKINPLANWSFDEVRAYVEEHKVPYNELHDKGYPSIGCSPCTRAVKDGEDPRAGRWWWEADPDSKECGLHVVPTPES